VSQYHVRPRSIAWQPESARAGSNGTERSRRKLLRRTRRKMIYRFPTLRCCVMPLPSFLLCFSVLQRLRFRWRLRRNVIGFGAVALFVSDAPIQTAALAEDQTQYIVDGLALGDPVAPKSAAYQEYKCRPSEQFESFIWCQRRRTENGNSVNSSLSILSSTR
jgi:hypothetical protein